jgi:hypothetical protein
MISLAPRTNPTARLALLSAVVLGAVTTAQTERRVERDAVLPTTERALAMPLVLEGFVLEPDGSPAAGAVVASSAGGRAVTGGAGRYRLEIEVPLEAESVEVTAVGAGGGQATRSVAVAGALGRAAVGPLTLSQSAACSASWLPTFGEQPGTSDSVHAMTSYDDGTGPALYVGGNFSRAGAALSSGGIARWDGDAWSSVGGGVSGGETIRALAVYDDGAGPALYAGGRFSSVGGVAASMVARWDGTAWAPLGSGTNDTVWALAVYDDGAGPALYAGGQFTLAGGVAASGIARWNGTSWSALGSGLAYTWPEFLRVRALAVYDDGSGPALHVGGAFSTAGGVYANGIAKWDGASWSGVGGSVLGILTLCVYDDGSGPALYAGGAFTSAGGVAARRIAKWDGTSWTGVGGGVGDTSVGDVDSLCVYDDGSGPALIAAGGFTIIGGISASRIARWDGESWARLDAGMDFGVSALTEFDDGNGPALFAGGSFERAGESVVLHAAKWDGGVWSPLGQGMNDAVQSLEVHDDGGGPALFAAGHFTTAGGVAAHRIARWDGTSWSQLGDGLSNIAWDMVVFDDGSGPKLHVGSGTLGFGSYFHTRVARWTGASWSALGSIGDSVHDVVRALAVHDDGGGPQLYAAGKFTTADGVAANRIVRWDGTSWSPLGSGISAAGTSEQTTALALASHDDGSGPALYVGGYFIYAGGVQVNSIARWNGTSWSALGSGMSGGPVQALVVHDDGGGPALFAAGHFTTAGGVAASRVARWNGTSWSALGSGMNGYVAALVVHDDGGGPALFAAGDFTTAGGAAANRIAKWDGTSWSALGGELSPYGVFALASYDDGVRGAPELYAGGFFTSAGDSGDSYLARWGRDTAPPVLSVAPVFAPDALGSPPGEIVHFSVSVSDDYDPAPNVVCAPPSGSFFPRGTTLVTCTATDACGNESSAQFQVTVLGKARER